MAPTRLDRLVIRGLETMCRWMWGFSPRMIRQIVGRMGALRALRWFAANMPRYLVTMRKLGPVRGHLACVTISLRNGCSYCAFGHAHALELLYLRDYDRLFPVDAHELAGWRDLDHRELGSSLRGVLQDAELQGEAPWVDRTLALVDGAQQPGNAAEARLAHLARMLGTTNEIAIDSGVSPDEAQNPINKDAALKARYAKLRATTG